VGGTACSRARRCYEQRHAREEGVTCGVSLARLQKDKAQEGGGAHGGVKRWAPVGNPMAVWRQRPTKRSARGAVAASA
jgi:hypothetical protein